MRKTVYGSDWPLTKTQGGRPESAPTCKKKKGLRPPHQAKKGKEKRQRRDNDLGRIIKHRAIHRHLHGLTGAEKD